MKNPKFEKKDAQRRLSGFRVARQRTLEGFRVAIDPKDHSDHDVFVKGCLECEAEVLQGLAENERDWN